MAQLIAPLLTRLNHARHKMVAPLLAAQLNQELMVAPLLAAQLDLAQALELMAQVGLVVRLAAVHSQDLEPQMVHLLAA
jgi:hypothetical protein